MKSEDILKNNNHHVFEKIIIRFEKADIVGFQFQCNRYKFCLLDIQMRTCHEKGLWSFREFSSMHSVN